jgi:CubicO group peptidase (beta-lactamase class C family)
MADLERSVPVSAETVFESGSVAKQFTAMAILLLAQQGKSPDPMRKYLPELPGLWRFADDLTLLSHVSGLRAGGGWSQRFVVRPRAPLSSIIRICWARPSDSVRSTSIRVSPNAPWRSRERFTLPPAAP